MNCPGHATSEGCFLPRKQGSFWGLCLSCERIQNRLFLEAVQGAIREGHSEFSFHGSTYSLLDPTFSTRFLHSFRFTASSQDPRLSLLTICYAKNIELFQNLVRAFSNDSGFLTSTNLLYRKHLPNRNTCAMLHKIQYSLQQRFLDMPCCPCCMSRYLLSVNQESITQRHIDHILSIFRNKILSQHPTWFVSIFRLLQTIWERDLENKIPFSLLNGVLIHENPVNYQIEFRDWMGAFLETPIVIEKILKQTISHENREFLQMWTGQQVNMPYLKRLHRSRMDAWKEDLIIKTWHPDRLMTWCLDLDELSDFA
jgi:hypothetical protein